jgi:hypothetical protein
MRRPAFADDAHDPPHARLVQKRLQLLDVLRGVLRCRPHVRDVADAVEAGLQFRQQRRDLRLSVRLSESIQCRNSRLRS